MSLKKSEKENKHKKFLSNKYKRIMKERQKKNKKKKPKKQISGIYIDKGYHSNSSKVIKVLEELKL